MPGVNYGDVQKAVPMTKVLSLIGFDARARRGAQWHGRCPVHDDDAPRSQAFSVNTKAGVAKCHRCGWQGNAIQLWAAVKRLPVYDAAVDLCRSAGVDVPWVKRW